MTDLIIPEMSLAEAQRTNAAIKAGITTLRALLLDMRDRKGWKVLGYSSFEEYGKTELDYGKAYLHHLANAADVAVSIGLSTKVDSIPETHLRPLAPLTDDDRRKVWEEATAQAEADQKKLTAKMVQEAVDRLNAEKAELQSNLALMEQRQEDWRQQAVTAKHKLTEAEQKLQTQQAEAASLRRTIATEAEKLASAKLLEIQNEADKLRATIKSLKQDRATAIEQGVTAKLREQQSEIDTREAQLTSLERRIAIQRDKLQQIDEQDRTYLHFDAAIKRIKGDMNSLSLALMDAFDPEAYAFLPDVFVRDLERTAIELEQGAAGIRKLLSQTEIRKIEVLVNE